MNLDFACHGDDKFHSRFATLPGKPKINLRFALDSLIFFQPNPPAKTMAEQEPVVVDGITYL